jgi:cytochrome o ubiquinol oxidase subunit 2
LTIQVIAEQFKWIFIYPEQNIATVNEVRFPEKTPLSFKITSNFTMNSFFIPQLGGQIYAMAGMQTHLHLQADETGVFRGISSNYSGYGFSQMRFKAHSVTDAEFAQWVEAVKAGKGNTINPAAVQKGLLDQPELAALKDGDRSKHQIEALVNRAKAAGDEEALAKAEAMKPFPNKPHPVTYYSSVEPKLFETVINRYMSNYHGADHSAGHATADTHAAAEHAAQGE